MDNLADANMRDAEEFCHAAFGPFVQDTSQYAIIVAQLLKGATERGMSAAAIRLFQMEERLVRVEYLLEHLCPDKSDDV